MHRAITIRNLISSSIGACAGISIPVCEFPDTHYDSDAYPRIAAGFGEQLGETRDLRCQVIHGHSRTASCMPSRRLWEIPGIPSGKALPRRQNGCDCDRIRGHNATVFALAVPPPACQPQSTSALLAAGVLGSSLPSGQPGASPGASCSLPDVSRNQPERDHQPDARAIEELEWNMAWHYALDVFCP